MKILSVDDVSMIRQIIKKNVENIGGVFLEASNGIEAMSVLELHEGKVDLILCDWNMPKMDGFHFLKSIKGNPRYKHIPVVMVTTDSEKDKIIQAVQTGASNYLVKPFTDQQLIKKITDCLHVKYKRFETCLLEALSNVLGVITRQEIIINDELVNQAQATEDTEQAIRQGHLFSGQVFIFGEINAIIILTMEKQNAAKLVSRISNNQSTADNLWDEQILAGVAKFTDILVKSAKTSLNKANINAEIKAPLVIAGYIGDTQSMLFNKTPFMTGKCIQSGDFVITQKIFFV